jgi:hypothetical protein
LLALPVMLAAFAWAGAEQEMNGGYHYPPGRPARRHGLSAAATAGLIVGLLLIGGWLLWSVVAGTVTEGGYTLRELHAACSNAFIGLLAGSHCASLDNFYSAAGVAFWVGLVLLAGSVVLSLPGLFRPASPAAFPPLPPCWRCGRPAAEHNGWQCPPGAVGSRLP